MLAYDYPILGVFWTMFIFFLWFAWLMLLFKVFIDIFRSEDLGGFRRPLDDLRDHLPFLGVFIYVIARGKSMGERDIARAKANDAAFRSYVQDAAGSSSAGTADELARLAELRDSGVLTDAEFAQQKAKLLA